MRFVKKIARFFLYPFRWMHAVHQELALLRSLMARKVFLDLHQSKFSDQEKEKMQALLAKESSPEPFCQGFFDVKKHP